MIDVRKSLRVSAALIITACGPSGSSDEATTNATDTGIGSETTGETASTSDEEAGSSSGAMEPAWQQWFGQYMPTEAEAGTGTNPAALFGFSMLDLRSDGTLSFHSGGGGLCLDEDNPPVVRDYRWVPDGDDRLRIEAMEPGAPLDLWNNGIPEAWIEAHAEPGSLAIRYIESDGEPGGGERWWPKCLCVPDPTECCATNCVDLPLEACAPDHVWLLCDE